MNNEKQIKLNKIDLFYIKGLLYTEKRIKQAQLEELKQKDKNGLTNTNILHIQAELTQITNILNNLN